MEYCVAMRINKPQLHTSVNLERFWSPIPMCVVKRAFPHKKKKLAETTI